MKQVGKKGTSKHSRNKNQISTIGLEQSLLQLLISQ